jgi:hypothetical protein
MPVALQTRSLTEPILDSGIQTTNYFNGRILNAGDLQTDQEAARAQREQLGLAIGHGIVRGFWAELADPGSGVSAPVVSVGNGLALNANGQALSLPVDVRMALTRATAPLPVDAGLFTDCAPPTATTVPLQAGIYILAASPASGYSGSAPMFAFGDTNAATGCGSRYAVEGVRFRLVQLDVASLPGIAQATKDAVSALMTNTDAASLAKLRNWIAHLCFGTEQLQGFLVNPFPPSAPPGSSARSTFVGYGAIDALVAAGALSNGDVPVALLYWTLQGVQFLDRWSVRRRLTAPLPPSLSWPLPYAPRRRADAEAVFLQFEEQLAAVFGSGISDATLAAFQAGQNFRYLPAAAPIPTNGGGARGFQIAQFLSGQTFRMPEFIEGAILPALYNRALGYAPISLTSQEAVWTYLVRDNIQAIDNATGAKPQQYIVVATGQMPFIGDARFDLNYWDYANFA